jgi:putative phosphoribosyl transferase
VRFADRWEAGRLLGAHLGPLAARHPVVLALPRGGVPVGTEVARALAAPLDVIVALKVGVPGQPELALGAVAPGVALVRQELVVLLEISDGYVETAIAELGPEVEARTRLLRGERPLPDLTGRAVVLVDDGLASGMTAAAAVAAIRAAGAAEVLVAVPVASGEAFCMLQGADQVVALSVPAEFGTVGQWYADFRPVSDAEVLGLLQRREGASRSLCTVAGHCVGKAPANER